MRPLAAALLLLPLLAGGPAARGEMLIDGIAAQVGGEVVLVSEVRELAASTEARARAQGATDEDIRQLYGEVLEQIIERALVHQVVKRAELTATDADVDGAIANIAKENGLTPEKLRETVEAQGMPFDLYRERIRGEIEHARVVSDLVATQVRIDESEVRAVYDEQVAAQPQGGEEFLLRVIVVTPKGDDPGALAVACAEVDDAKERISVGEAFELVAAEVSEANPEAGGAQGWVHEAELASWMRAPVKGLQPGGVSERIDAGFGCGLVQVVERRSFEPLAWDQAKVRIQSRLFDERMEAEYKKLIERLRAQTYIERKGLFGDGGPPRQGASLGTDGEPGF